MWPPIQCMDTVMRRGREERMVTHVCRIIFGERDVGGPFRRIKG